MTAGTTSTPGRAPAPALLRARIDSFRYAGAAAETLSGLDVRLEPGTLTAIIGASGSGKSTLARVLGGMLPEHHGRGGSGEVRGSGPADAGAGDAAGEHDDVLRAEFELDGECIRIGPDEVTRINVRAWAARVAVLPQEARHFLSGARERVDEELAFTLEQHGAPREDMRERVAAVAAELGMEALLGRDVERLSGGQAHLTALAALAVPGARVLILDEPLAGLDAQVLAGVVSWIDRLRAEGFAVLHLTRREDALSRCADAVYRLRQGGLVPMLATAAHSLPAARTAPDTPAAGAVLLRFEGADLGYPAPRRRGWWRRQEPPVPVLAGVDLQVRAGETVALLGPNGVGKSTLLRTAAGLLPTLGGRLERSGRVGLLLQDASDQLFERTVRREVAFGIQDPAAVARVLDDLGLTAYADVHPYELPGSARRLVALATVLARQPRVLLCDEPTVALDQDGLDLLRNVFGRQVSRGGAVLFTTHEADFARAAATRTVTLA